MTHRFSQLAGYILTVFLAALFSIGSAFAEKVLYTFPYTGENGLHPQAKLVYRSGKLYGTTQQGGSSLCTPTYDGCGVVFEVAESGISTNFRVLYAFKGGEDVSTPVGNIVFDAAGNLYGVASGGGAHNLGGIFKLAPGAGGNWTETIVHSFAGADGQVPRAGLTIDATGNLYGTAGSGGTYGWGLVFELSPGPHGGWTDSILYNFQGSPDGAVPWGEVSFDSLGNIYGVTGAGGENSSGAVYELVPNGTGGWRESVIYAGFKNAQIGYPHSELLLAATGDIFGIGQGDGEGGEVFHLVPNNDGFWTETTILNFGAHSGVNPYGGLVADAAGNLYGTTPGGGFYDLGTIYRLSPELDGSWTRSTVHSFAAEGRGDGENPEGGLTQGEPGVYYGTTFGELQEGTEAGTVFTIKP